eukprot:TRINITY_DN10639_c0_g1_i1.p1 TRINITY_DN10639_c0_g1~~TRINITY_DN10639_c0_g1_i1.p1  ORF type:complete len:102 (+),score=21.91 TRINITY_DN10639_c0_g1_i1:99-404(+)
MLYPVENKNERRLDMMCKNCEFTETAKNNCVYVHHITEKEEEKSISWKDVHFDLTLPRTFNAKCTRCDYTEAVYKQVKYSDSVSLFCVCANPGCGHHWKET